MNSFFNILASSPVGLFFILAALTLTIGCTKSEGDCPDVQPNDGYLIYSYYNDSIPTIDQEPQDKSDFVFVTDSASATLDGLDAVITIPGIRVRDGENNYTIEEFFIEEKTNLNDACFKIDGEFNLNFTAEVPNIASVLVLDMSTSLGALVDDIKTYAKDYATTIVNTTVASKVAVVFFSAKENIVTTDFYDSSNIEDLNNQIDDFEDYQSRTALFLATKNGIDLLDNEDFEGEKSLVIFTDGNNNDTPNANQVLDEIKTSLTPKFVIGLGPTTGVDALDTSVLSQLSGNNSPIVAADSTALEDVFRIAKQSVTSVANLEYRRSNVTFNSDEAIEIRIRLETKIIE